MSDAHPDPKDEAGHDEPAAPARRDEAVERLKRAVAEEREHSAALRSSVDDLRFKTEILERSYSKQLEDARLRAETAERRYEEQGARIAELDAAREDAIALLTETKAELDRLTTERNQLRRQLASKDGWQTGAASDDGDFSGEEGTINTLLDDAKWIREREPTEEEKARAEAAAREAEAPAEEMISPDVVLAARKKD